MDTTEHEFPVLGQRKTKTNMKSNVAFKGFLLRKFNDGEYCCMEKKWRMTLNVLWEASKNTQSQVSCFTMFPQSIQKI